jgi:hypothetical protein
MMMKEKKIGAFGARIECAHMPLYTYPSELLYAGTLGFAVCNLASSLGAIYPLFTGDR